MKEKDITFEDKLWKAVDKLRKKDVERGEDEEKINEVGFAKVASIEEIAKNGSVLTPGRYVRIKFEEEEEPFEEKMKTYFEELSRLLKEEKELTDKIKEIFKNLIKRYKNER